MHFKTASDIVKANKQRLIREGRHYVLHRGDYMAPIRYYTLREAVNRALRFVTPSEQWKAMGIQDTD